RKMSSSESRLWLRRRICTFWSEAIWYNWRTSRPSGRISLRRPCAPLAVSQPSFSMASTKAPLTPPRVSSSRKRRLARRSSSRLQNAAMLPSLRISTSSQHSSTSRNRGEERSRGRSPRGRVEPVGGLIQNQHLGAVRDGLRQFGGLLHAQRVGAQRAVTNFAEADVEE